MMIKRKRISKKGVKYLTKDQLEQILVSYHQSDIKDVYLESMSKNEMVSMVEDNFDAYSRGKKFIIERRVY